MSYNSTVNNLEAISLLTMRDGTEVVFDKPGIDAIQCNLGNSWQQASSGTHVQNLYSLDSDIYKDLLKGWSQLDKRYLQTVNNDVIDSFKFQVSDLNSNLQGMNMGGGKINRLVRKNCGSNVMYFDVSPADELGVSAGQYSRLVNVRFNTNQPPGYTNTTSERSKV